MSNAKKRKSSTNTNWNVKGVKPETRAKIKAAAKKSGMTIGAYVDRVLMDAATNDLKRSKQLPVKMEDVQTQLTDMKEMITQLSTKLEQPKETLWKRLFS